MPKPRNLFSPGDIDNLRRGYYTQAATVAAVVLDAVAIGDTIEAEDIETAADVTIDLIEALIDRIQGVEP